MIYLITQMMLSLALAAVVGGAIGWVLQRARAGKQIQQLQADITRQQAQVSQARTEVKIISDDFDELRQHSQSQIAELNEQNRALPSLNQNLEKSQLLVRQMLQNHEAELRDLATQNASLSDKLKTLKQSEQTITRLQAELDVERRRTAQHSGQTAGITAASAEQTELNLSNDSQASAVPATSGDHMIDTAIANSRLTPASPASSTATSKSGSAAGSKASAISDTSAQLESLRDELADTQTASTHNSATNAALAGAAETGSKSAAKAAPVATLTGTAPAPGKATPVKRDKGTPVAEVEQVFDAVEEHDDLKQIFGIGPVTEQTLNKLGITSYSQLAELKRHDIEKIADALQILPARIERDNWVGSARQQLEEVLEGL